MQLLLFHLPLPMATSSSWPGMSPLWTKSWSPKLTLEGWGGGQLRQDGNLPSLLWTRGLSLDLSSSSLLSSFSLVDDEQPEKVFTQY